MLQMKTKAGRASRFSLICWSGSSNALLLSAKSSLEAFMTFNASSNFLFLSKSKSATAAGEEPGAVPDNILSSNDISSVWASANAWAGGPFFRDWQLFF